MRSVLGMAVAVLACGVAVGQPKSGAPTGPVTVKVELGRVRAAGETEDLIISAVVRGDGKTAESYLQIEGSKVDSKNHGVIPPEDLVATAEALEVMAARCEIGKPVADRTVGGYTLGVVADGEKFAVKFARQRDPKQGQLGLQVTFTTDGATEFAKVLQRGPKVFARVKKFADLGNILSEPEEGFSLSKSCQKLLDLQAGVHKGTRELHKAIEDNPDKKPSASDLRAAAELADGTMVLVKETSKVMTALEADGSAAVFHAVLLDLRDELKVIQARLEKGDVGPATQKLQNEVMDSLRTMIDASKKMR